jgi:hypothetical protein
VGIFYIGVLNLFHYSLLPLYFLPPFLNSFQFTSLYHLPSKMLFFDITDALSFPFPFSLSLSSIGTCLELQTCFTYDFVHDHACFCVYAYLLALSSTYDRKHPAFVSLSLVYFI